jgi:hypothetical protein
LSIAACNMCNNYNIGNCIGPSVARPDESSVSNDAVLEGWCDNADHLVKN